MYLIDFMKPSVSVSQISKSTRSDKPQETSCISPLQRGGGGGRARALYVGAGAQMLL